MQYVLAAWMPRPPALVWLTLGQLPVLVPYCWLRDIHYLTYPMLIANICLWGALIGVLALIGTTLAHDGAAPVAWVRFGTGSLLFTAQAVVAFEGIGLVLPIRASMREPAHFTPVLLGCMAAGTCALLLSLIHI